MDTALPLFLKTLYEKFHTSPSGSTLSAYVSALWLMQTFAQHPDIKTSSELDLALRNATQVTTPDGNFPIKDRSIIFPLVEREIHDGKPRTVG